MMAYGSDFVLAIMHKGSPVREINGKVHVPFSSEYKVRLKNKHSYLRAKARVWIDGRQVSNLGDFILQPGQTLDLERFLDASLSQGNRFKFVPLSDSRVNDPTDGNNGVVKVEFYRENDFKIDWPKTVSPVKPYTGRGSTGDPDWTFTSNPNWTPFETLTFNSQSLGSTKISSTMSMNFLACAATMPANGATVEGDISNQQFVQGADFTTDLFPTTLTLQIRGIENSGSPKISIVPSEGKKVRFCSNCGKRRSRRSDKFCGRCGNTF